MYRAGDLSQRPNGIAKKIITTPLSSVSIQPFIRSCDYPINFNGKIFPQNAQPSHAGGNLIIRREKFMKIDAEDSGRGGSFGKLGSRVSCAFWIGLPHTAIGLYRRLGDASGVAQPVTAS